VFNVVGSSLGPISSTKRCCRQILTVPLKREWSRVSEVKTWVGGGGGLAVRERAFSGGNKFSAVTVLLVAAHTWTRTRLEVKQREEMRRSSPHSIGIFNFDVDLGRAVLFKFCTLTFGGGGGVQPRIFSATTGRVALQACSAVYNLGVNSAFAVRPSKIAANLDRVGQSFVLVSRQPQSGV
jgi:hypothetical protein